MAGQHPTFPKLKIKLGGKVFNEAEARASDAQPSGDANASSPSKVTDTQAGARSPTSHALAIMSKMGAGRLGKGRQFMPPLPESWASLKDHVVTQQAHFVCPDPTAPSKGTSGKAQKPSRPSSKGTVKEASSKEARSYKRLRKSSSPALSEAAEQAPSAQTATPLTGALPQRLLPLSSQSQRLNKA
ncbi:hypothetical protein WJX82_002488 [Trebouxia sp. C0006]